jgi:hypothetical protein
MKHTLVLDIECYRDYFLVGFTRVDTGAVRDYEMFEFQALDHATIVSILKNYRIVTFNGNNYDMPILMLALQLAGEVSRGDITALEACQRLKEASDRIIEEQMRSWQFENYYGVKVPGYVDHIDLIEAVPGVQIGLKLYGARLHSKKLQDLPIEPDASISPEQRPVLVLYCRNDRLVTIDLWNKARDPKDDIIETRELVGREFAMDLRSKSDAQMAEAVIKARIQKMNGERVYPQQVRPGTRYRYNPPAFLQFRSQVLKDKLAEIVASEFIVKGDGKIEMPKCLEGAVIEIGDSKFKMGVGGLHSTEKSKAHVASESVLLRDRDVVSFYPKLILQCGLFPENMGVHFQRIYKDFFDRRVAAKKAGNKSVAQTFKIFLNGTFGKLGSRYSVLYAPNLLLQVTVTGQLVLLMMIERMVAAGIPVVSANTDGIVMACPKYLEPTMLEIVAQWERETGLETEETQYAALYSRDVNNYLAVKPDGTTKGKGVFAEPSVMKSPTNDIVGDAVKAALVDRVPVAETVLRCRDVRKFLSVKRVTGGALYDGTYLGKTVRWYRRRNEQRAINYKKNGNQVGGSFGAAPLMDLPDEFPADLDHEFYIAEANDLLREIGAARG